MRSCWSAISSNGDLHIENVDGWFSSKQTFNDIGIYRLVRQEADGHARFGVAGRRPA